MTMTWQASTQWHKLTNTHIHSPTYTYTRTHANKHAYCTHIQKSHSFRFRTHRHTHITHTHTHAHSGNRRTGTCSIQIWIVFSVWFMIPTVDIWRVLAKRAVTSGETVKALRITRPLSFPKNFLLFARSEIIFVACCSTIMHTVTHMDTYAYISHDTTVAVVVASAV